MFAERDVIKPFVGEIVAARYSTDNNWYRARVLAIKGDYVKVCVCVNSNNIPVSTNAGT